MEKSQFIKRELFRIFLIVCFPLVLTMWITLCKEGTVKDRFLFYWMSVFTKDINLDYFKE